MTGLHNLPQSCYESGLTCVSCAENAGRSLAKVCRGLQGKAVGQIFVQIYTDPVCTPMLGNFSAAYREADRGEAFGPDSPPLRKPAARGRARAMAAVA